jgi:hypothetical protein
MDSMASMGYGATRSVERVAASLGWLCEAPLVFEPAWDVPQGGVLLALPSLLEQGLLRHAKSYYQLPPGFYGLETLFLLLALLALVRCRSLEQVRYESPGEWGKLLGLDRIPEVRTLREKLAVLCAEKGRAAQWGGVLSQEWMSAKGDGVGVYYADGHVRVYHGSLTELPRRYVARERLCLRGTTDYWVNALDGRPFFVVSQAVNPGLIDVLRERIVPRLKAEAPGQPSEAELAADPEAIRFVLVFDREGYSPDFWAWLKTERIAALTYHKYPGADWPVSDFAECAIQLANGEETTLSLAEKSVVLSNGLAAREIRCRKDSGHQTSMLTTDPRTDMLRVAPRMFARWCQENFFRYMAEHYGLDRLAQYGTEPLPETTRVVNPAWRQLDQAVRRERGHLISLQARFAQRNFQGPLAPAEVEAYTLQQGELQEECQRREQQLDTLKAQRKTTPRHVLLKDLPEGQRFEQLCTESKHFVDTIKLIAYRAETAMVSVLRERLARVDDARSLVRQIYQTPVDLLPDRTAKTLTVRVHHQASALQDAALARLCEETTVTEILFPGTDLRMIFKLLGSS